MHIPIDGFKWHSPELVEKLDFADPNCKIVNNVYATFWGANKVYYGKCGISESRHLKKIWDYGDRKGCVPLEKFWLRPCCC